MGELIDLNTLGEQMIPGANATFSGVGSILVQFGPFWFNL